MTKKTSANNGSGNNINRDDWETPQWLYDLLNEQYGFNFDCCATLDNAKSSFAENFLDTSKLFMNIHIAWMNPPFSKARTMFEHFFCVVSKGVAIYRCDNFETQIWQETIFSLCDWVFIPNKRINYESKNGKGSRFPSALIGKGLKPPENIKGTLLYISNKKLNEDDKHEKN